MAGEVVASLHQTKDWQTRDWQTRGWANTGWERQGDGEIRSARREALAVRGLSKWFGDEKVLDDVSFSIAEGESLVLLGHSGSGKSTTLRLIAGLETPGHGEVVLHGRRIEHLRARERNVGVIFQNYALFPRMTVAENIGFGLRIRGERRKRREAVIDEMLALIGLSDQREKYPSQISGGQQQRVAIARALAYKPEVLLFDESFSALDQQTRVGLRREIRTLLRKLRVPALFITHDQEEAMELGDHIAILNRGRIEQIGTPEDVYNEPQTEFVATFLGAANVIEGCWRDGFIAIDCQQCMAAPRPIQASMQKAKMVFRPEDITLHSATGFVEAPYLLGRGEVLDVSFTGANESLMIRLLPRGFAGQVNIPDCGNNLNTPCNLVIKVTRTKWDARRLHLAPGDSVSVGLKSYKTLRG
ncbi:MAG: ABC transporter ATP-binding protein [Blastocatellia bacterium]|nr:ABC transporter ATP-binding protein [Blastocatellia bacterium]